jgi:hypothetical protein
MKFRYLIASALFFSLAPVAMAEERPVKAADSNVEVKMRVIKRGDRYVGYHNNREYHLRGDSVTRFRGNGDYVVHGHFGTDNTSFETRELRPVEYRMRVSKRGDRFIGVYENREYVLRGNVAINNDGEYVVYGEVGPDGTTFETAELQPVTVQAPPVVVNAPTEYRMRVVRRGDRFIGFYNNREYVLRGNSVTHVTADGEYIVHGEIGSDGTYIETREVRPVVVVQEAPPRQDVIIVKERRDPIIKLGPLEIGR